MHMKKKNNIRKNDNIAPKTYDQFLEHVKTDILQTQLKAAQLVTVDHYPFDFLTIQEEAMESEIEKELMSHLQKFLLELGQGFSFVGRQYHLMAGTKDLYIDMLFYHLQLRCFIVVELKAKEFDARDVEQIGVYLAAVDNLLKHPGDEPTIGLLLCKSKDNIMAEWALSSSNRPIGISSYTTKLIETLPKELKGKLPTIEEIETELKKTNALIKPTKVIKKKTTKKRTVKNK